MSALLGFVTEPDGGDVLLATAMLIVGALIIIVAIVSCIVSIVLAIRYIKFNRRANSAGLTGVEAARAILDANGLQHIKVKTVGSLMFGNSYSHYFKKVRLRRLTRHKTSITALAMGSQKAALAVLDKEGDPDMKRRIRLVPLITFGPFAFIPLIIVGAIIDILVFHTVGVITVALAIIGFLFYILALVLTIVTLKTEKKAQERAYSLLRENGMATEEELELMRELFKLYNIQYVNDIILSALEIIWRILEILARAKSNSASRR
ncbi:MAG: zinc metallopeptidase [Clostridiales bacterium]|nr:zinc metallopeptidase [Clostridiales bacterium]